jgi:hypothetical protein
VRRRSATGELAQRQGRHERLKPTEKPQKPADVKGLFGDERNQGDLLDVKSPTDAIEAALGTDADKVAPVDIARAAEIMADSPGMAPATAFGQRRDRERRRAGFHHRTGGH